MLNLIKENFTVYFIILAQCVIFSALALGAFNDLSSGFSIAFSVVVLALCASSILISLKIKLSQPGDSKASLMA